MPDETPCPAYKAISHHGFHEHMHQSFFRLNKKPDGTTTESWLRQAIWDIAARHTAEMKDVVKEVTFQLDDEDTDVTMMAPPVEIGTTAMALALCFLALKFTVHHDTRPRHDLLTFTTIFNSE